MSRSTSTITNFPDASTGVTLRSSIPYGQIKNIRFDPKFPWDECVIARAEDIPGRNYVALIEEDQPLLAEKRSNARDGAHPDRRPSGPPDRV